MVASCGGCFGLWFIHERWWFCCVGWFGCVMWRGLVAVLAVCEFSCICCLVAGFARFLCLVGALICGFVVSRFALGLVVIDCCLLWCGFGFVCFY